MPLRSSPWLSAARSLSACADSVCWRSDVDGSLDVDTMSFVPVRPNLKARSIPQWTYAYSGVPGGSPLQRSNPPSHLMLPSSSRWTSSSRQPAEWFDEVRHGRALHGSIQGPHGVAVQAGTVSGQCTWTLHRHAVRAATSSASTHREEGFATADHGWTGRRPKYGRMRNWMLSNGLCLG